MVLVPLFRGVRSAARTVLAPVCAAAAVVLAVRDVRHERTVLLVAVTAFGVLSAIERLHARRRVRIADTRVPAVDGGSAMMIVALAYVTAALSGRGHSSALDALPIVAVAAMAALGSPAVGVASAAIALAAEALAHLAAPVMDARTFGIRAALVVVAAALHHGLTRREIGRVRDHAQRVLDDDRAKQKDAARSFRLLSAPNAPPRNQEHDEDRRLRGSLEQIRESLEGMLDVTRRAMGLRTCALYWLDARGQSLRLVEAVTDAPAALRHDPISVGAGAVGGACALGKPVILSRLRPDYAGLTYYQGDHGVQAFAAVPVLERGEVRGVLVADRASVTVFDSADQETLGRVASQALRHVHNERVFRMLEKTKDELAKLFAASRALGEALTEDQVIAAVARSSRAVVEHDVVVLATYDPRTREHRVRHAGGTGAEALEGKSFPHNAGIASAAVESRHVLPYRGHFDSKTQFVFTRDATLDGHQSVLCLPLVVRDHAIGTLTLAAHRRGAFGDGTRQLLGVLAGHAAVALSNAAAVKRLEELATTDPMTGLLNKRSLEAEFDRRIRSATRFGKSLSVLVLDIDKFKNVNDTYGHSTGDVVIKGLGTVLTGKKRETDAVARFGGEEFVVLCEETDIEGAYFLAERIREELERTVFHTETGPLNVTCSVGVAEFPRDGDTRETLFSRADEALYEAKRNGRNQTRIAGRRQPPVGTERRGPGAPPGDKRVSAPRLQRASVR